jgi:hypothetical protein
VAQFEIQPRINANERGSEGDRTGKSPTPKSFLNSLLLLACKAYLFEYSLFRSAFIRVNPRLNTWLRCHYLQSDPLPRAELNDDNMPEVADTFWFVRPRVTIFHLEVGFADTYELKGILRECFY